jgi:hypothetical protein
MKCETPRENFQGRQDINNYYIYLFTVRFEFRIIALGTDGRRPLL